MKPYAEQVPSGHEWLGAVPSHWTLSPLGSHFEERSEMVSDADFPPLSVTKQGVVPQIANVALSVNNDKRKLVLAGDYAINSRSDRKGSSGLSDLDGSVSVVYTVMKPRPSIDGRFAHHLLRSTAFQEEFYRWGSGIVADLWSTRFSSMKSIALALPPLSEQRTIADYLDRETARIDELITAQGQLIEMLGERRRAVVVDAVASVDAPKTALRYFARLVSGSGFPVELQGQVGEALAFFKVKDLQTANSRGVLKPAQDTICHETARSLRASVIPAGSLVFAKVGAALLLGRVAALPVDGCIDNNMSAVVFNERFDPAFARYVMLTFEFGRNVQPGAVPSLNMEGLREFRVPLVDLDVQRRVAAKIEDQIMSIDSLTVEAERLIDLVRERRAALITAAVTGQIDVRQAAD